MAAGSHLVTGRLLNQTHNQSPVEYTATPEEVKVTARIEKVIIDALRRLGIEANVAVTRSPSNLITDQSVGLLFFAGVVALGVLAMLLWFWLRLSSELQTTVLRQRDCSDDDDADGAQDATSRLAASPSGVGRDSGVVREDDASPCTPAQPAAELLIVSAARPHDGIFEVLMVRYNVLLLFVPLGWLSSWLHCGSIATFLLNLVAVVPLATLIGEATEELALALGTGATIGGLINASLGNAVEVIILLQTLGHGQVEATKGALLGSILINELFVLGASMFFGGLLHRGESSWEAASGKEQAYSNSTARMMAQATVFGSFCLAMPSIFGLEAVDTPETTLLFSRAGSAVLLVGYCTFLLFQLGSHAVLMQGTVDHEEESRLTVKEALVLLVASTASVTLSSHYMVHEMDPFVKDSGVSKSFLYVVLLPLVGNACEHAVAVIMATRDKMDLAIAIGLGSAIQMALCATPLMVVVGWAIDQPMDLDFHPRNAFTLIISALLVSGALNLRRTNWLLGAMFMGAYMLIVILFYFSPEGPI